MPQLLPPPKFRAVDGDGNPLVGGKLYTYTAGTTTPKNSYTSYTMGTANTNPVILDSRGEADVWLDGAYKVRLLDSDDTLVWEVDDVRDLTSSQTFTNATLAGTLTVSSTAVTWSGNPTHSGNHTFTSNVTINGNTTLGNAATDTLTVNADATFADDLTVTGNTTLNGNTVVGNAGSDTLTLTAATTITGNVTVSTTGGELYPGKYTPTLGAVTLNVSASSANEHRYMRMGDIVLVNGSISVTPTSGASAATQISISLPIASNLSSLLDIQAPAANHSDLGNTVPFLTASAASDVAVLNFTAGSTTASTWSYTFTYEVK